MIKKLYPYLVLLVSFSSISCETLSEPFKTFWGSSTRALENARIDSLSKIYTCEFNDCFNAVLSLQRKPTNERKNLEDKEVAESIGLGEFPSTEGLTGEEKQGLDVFMKDRIRAFIVVMGIYGNTDTTEVGIFFSRYNRESFKIEISSLSESAKLKVSEMVFEKLDQQFKEVK